MSEVFGVEYLKILHFKFCSSAMKNISPSSSPNLLSHSNGNAGLNNETA